MRRPERLKKIYEFFKENAVPFREFLRLEDPKEGLKIYKRFVKDYDKLLELHTKHPDLRLGQFLIVENITPDYPGVFGSEEVSWLIRNKYFEERELMLWGSYGINGDEPVKYRYLDDLDSNHIANILRNCDLPTRWNKIFTDILIERENK
jgi:hypothetical protein